MLSNNLSVKPQFKNKYYVYALCRPNGIPFYVGKGKDNRINDHFANNSLNRSNSRKNLAIKKYGSHVKREILAYFDSEDSAYEYERFLISHYKLQSDGGVLYQYSYGNGDTYSSNFSTDISAKAYSGRNRVIEESKVLKVYTMFFTDCRTLEDIVNETGINYSYISQLCCGHKDKKLYSEYVESGVIVNNRKNTKVRRKKGASNRIDTLPDSIFIEYYDYWYNNTKSLATIASELRISKDKLRNIFYGNDRSHLFKHRELPKKVIKLTDDDLKTILYEFYVNNKTNKEVSEMFGVNERRLRDIKSCVKNYSHLYEYKKEIMERQ